MCDWILFSPDEQSKELYVEILINKFMDIQPRSMEAADKYCEDILFPMVDQIQKLCLEKGYRQLVTSNLSNVDIRRAKVHVMGRMAWNVYQHTKNCILLDGCQIAGTNPILDSLISLFKSFLPSFIRNKFVTIPDDNSSDEQ